MSRLIALVGCTLGALAVAVTALNVSFLAADEAAPAAAQPAAKPAATPSDAAAAAYPAPRSMAQAAEQQILAELEKPTQFEFIETPLYDVVEMLSARHKLEIQLDKKALDDDGIGNDTPVTRHVRGVSLKSALRLLLRELNLTYLVQDETLLITTKTQAESQLTTTVYDVRDLLEADRQERLSRGELGLDWDIDSLIEVVEQGIAPNSWDNVGGPGSISSVYGTLVVSQTQEAHEQLTDLLAQLRRTTQARPAQHAGQAKPNVAAADANALSVRVYQIGAPAYGFGGMGGGFGGGGGGFFQVAPAAPSQPAATPDAAKPEAKAQPQTPKIDAFRCAQQLALAIPDTIAPETWQQHGGEGSVQAVPSPLADGQGSVLIVRQTREVHAQVDRLLRDLKFGIEYAKSR